MSARAWDSPDVFKGTALQRYEPYPIVTGTAYSSHAPASFWMHPINLAAPLVISNVNVFKSLNAGVPTATALLSTGSQAFSYSHGLSLYQRQDYGANSTNFSFLGTASAGLTATLGYSSVSQRFGLSWVTNNTGGTSAFTTTSADGGWSSFATGPKVLQIPWQTTLSVGEYWIAHGHSSTTATSNSNLTLMSVSNLHIAPQLVTYGSLGGSVTLASSGPYGFGLGIASALTTNATMAGSVVSAGTVNLWVQEFSNV